MGGNERYGSEVLVCFLFQGPSIKGTSGRLGKYSGERLKEVKSFLFQKKTP